MQDKNITDILKRLHTTNRNPRLEIEGAGKPSIEAQHFGWIEDNQEGEGKTAIYVIRDWYEDTSYVTHYDIEYISLPKPGIESLIEYALSSGIKTAIYTKGTHVKHNERWDDYTSSHDGSPAEFTDVLVELSLDLLGEKPDFSLQQLPFLPYPKDLPIIAVANRDPLCINCGHVWLEPFGGRDPDFNYCTQMDLTRDACTSLNPQQAKRLEELVDNGVLCPVFKQTRRYSNK